MAERLARRRFDLALGPQAERVIVASAGTRADVGVPMHPTAAELLRERGADAEHFASLAVTPKLLTTADLVLTATRGQRSTCVSLAPDAVSTVFTLKQFGRLVSVADRISPAPAPQWTDPARALRALVDAAVAARHRLQPADDDLADPLRHPIEAFRACADEIEQVLDAVVRAVQPVVTVS
jgi:protein-tyrosine phosphatase